MSLQKNNKGLLKTGLRSFVKQNGFRGVCFCTEHDVRWSLTDVVKHMTFMQWKLKLIGNVLQFKSEIRVSF